MAQDQNAVRLFPKTNLLRVWFAFLGNNTPMEVWVFRNYLDEDFRIFPEVVSFQDFIQKISGLSGLSGLTARVHIDHHSECDLTPRLRPCKIRVVFQLPVQY